MAGHSPDRAPAAVSTSGRPHLRRGARLALCTVGTYRPESPHLLADRTTAEPCFGPGQINHLDEALTAAGVRHHSEICTAHRGATRPTPPPAKALRTSATGPHW
ncbi:hypothetical protein ACIA8E_35325 [Streptomyces sp. NPDC051664]|uniref:hypothetical protein n=1 Tax=Streptomyces sp. NPDC051664 TaxID=3365668 RepID=UPI00378735EE